MTTVQKVWIGAAVLGILVLFVWLTISAIQRNARDLAIAEERERAAVVMAQESAKREAERRIEREQTARLIEANADLVARLQATVSARNAEAARIRAALVAPKTPAQVATDSQTHLGYTPPVQDGSFRLTQEQFQELIAIKVDRDRLVLNNSDLERQLRLVQDVATRLTSEKSGYEAGLREKDEVIAAQAKVIDSYKKIAKRGAWRKFGGVMGRVGLAVLPALVVAAALR